MKIVSKVIEIPNLDQSQDLRGKNIDPGLRHCSINMVVDQ